MEIVAITAEMALNSLVFCLFLFSHGLAVKFTFEPELPRQEKSLLNTFPFNQQEDSAGQEHHAHHANHEENEESADSRPSTYSRGLSDRQPQIQLDARNSLQGSDVSGVSFNEVSQSGTGSDGKRCIDKVEMVEETEYDDVVQCDHSYDRRCHISYITNYVSQQEVECEENYVKSCFIDYEQIAFNETITVCRNPLVKDCDVSGPEICRTVYESECWTKQEVHDVEDDVVSCRTENEEKCEDETSGYTTSTKCSKWPKEVCSVSKKQVKKYTPVTGCNKEPRELCAPSGCGFKQVRTLNYIIINYTTYSQGPEECQDKTKTIVQDAPKEECTLEPRRTCKHVTKLVPKLEPKEECVDVPKEVCTRSRQNPRKVRKPVIKKWCYVPSEESGLA